MDPYLFADVLPGAFRSAGHLASLLNLSHLSFVRNIYISVFLLSRGNGSIMMFLKEHCSSDARSSIVSAHSLECCDLR